MKKKLIEFLPPEIANIKDFKEIMNTETIELDLIEKKQEQLLKENFIDTATSKGIKHQEKLFKIRADVSNENLEFRKLRIKNRKIDKAPFTHKFLEYKLEALFGKDNYKLDVFNDEYILKVDINTFDWNMFNEIVDNFRIIIPCDMILKATLICENNTNLNIRTKFDKYEFYNNMCGTFQCGTVPAYSNQGVTIQENLNINSNNANWEQKYKLCGGVEI